MCTKNAHLIQSLDANRAPVASTPAVFSTSVQIIVARGRQSVQVRSRILSGAMFLARRFGMVGEQRARTKGIR